MTKILSLAAMVGLAGRSLVNSRCARRSFSVRSRAIIPRAWIRRWTPGRVWLCTWAPDASTRSIPGHPGASG